MNCEVPLLMGESSAAMEQAGWRLFVKKTVDRTAAAIGLVATAPLMAGAALAVRATMGAPALFSQQRPGLHGKPFKIWKFRTMSNARDASGTLLPDAERLTNVGRFLRKTSIDELPQLWCVVKGDLSLVGPRPLLMKYLPFYTPEENRRHDVLPGITGLAAVNGRNLLSWEEKFRLDVEYVDRWDLALDAKILVQTARKVLLREGIGTTVQEIMPELRHFQHRSHL